LVKPWQALGQLSRRRGLLAFRELATDEQASPFGADRLVVGMILRDREHLPGP
jgi:hypothetical protein